MNDLLITAREIILKNHKKNMAISFDELWKKTANSTGRKVNDDDLMSEFYLALLQDPNFIKLTNNEWTLKQLHTYSDVEKMSANIYKTEEFEIAEGDYDQFMSKYEINELKHKSRNSDTTALDLDELENDGDDSQVDAMEIEFDDDDFDDMEEK